MTEDRYEQVPLEDIDLPDDVEITANPSGLVTVTFVTQSHTSSATTYDKGNPGYRIFRSPYERKTMVEILGNTANHVEEGDVSNLVFIDSAARPMAIGFKEYWKLTHEPDETAPSIFFINPSGFRNNFELATELEARHPQLYAQRDRKTLLVDTCIHSGTTIKPVISGLRDVGFTDLSLALMGDQNYGLYANRSGIKPDIVLDPQNNPGCYPFEIDTLVSKGRRGYSVVSIPAKNSSSNPIVNQLSGNQIRKEIVRLVQEGLASSPEPEVDDADIDLTSSDTEVRNKLKRGGTKGYLLGYLGGMTTGIGANIMLSTDGRITRLLINIGSTVIGAVAGTRVGIRVTANKIIKEIRKEEV